MYQKSYNSRKETKLKMKYNFLLSVFDSRQYYIFNLYFISIIFLSQKIMQAIGLGTSLLSR